MKLTRIQRLLDDENDEETKGPAPRLRLGGYCILLVQSVLCI